MSNLKIIFWNSNGIRHKLNELRSLALLRKIDIILLNETKILPTTKLHIPNYITYRNDLPPVRGSPAHGGTAVLIHRRIVHQQITLNTTIQTSSVLIKLNNHEVLVSAVYKPPGTVLTTNDLNLLTQSSEWQISAGDFNAKHSLWYSHSINATGRILFDHVQQSDYVISAPTSPTYYPTNPNHRPDILDIALLRLPYLTTIQNLNELSSDHNPILLETSANPITSSPTTTNSFINWKKFNNILTNVPNSTIRPSSNRQSIDSALDNLTKNIQHAIEASVHTPKRKNSPQPLPDYIKLEITTKNRLRREWQRHRDPNTKRQLNAKTTFVRNLLETYRTDQWDIFLNSLDHRDGSIFKLNKSLLHKRPASHPLLGPNGLVFPANDRAELLADSLERQFQTNQGPDIPEITAHYQLLHNSNHNKSKLYTTPGTIQTIIRNLCKKKAPGDDHITNTALKFLPNNMLLSLTEIINCSFRICYFPLAWKKAVIISIPKPGKDHKNPESYRPIALLSSLSKIYERLILSYIQNSLHNKIRPEQFSYRPEHSSTLLLTKLTHQLSQNFNNDLNTASIFLDVEKAFDRVWHEGLLYKLSLTNIPPEIIHIIKSFLTDRTFITKIDDSFSTLRKIRAGVPQGSCLSPTLYLIYINDIPTTPKTHLSLFADDTMFYTFDKNPIRAAIQLQHQLDLVLRWFHRWRIKINSTKTISVLFGRSNSTHVPPPRIDNHTINWSKQVKYLGVTIGRKLTFGQHVLNSTKKATRTRGMLYPILNKTSPVPTKTKLNILKLYISPLLTYAGPAWAPFLGPSHWKRIEAVQTIGIRTITGMPSIVKNSVLLKSANIFSIQQSIKFQTKNLFYKSSFSDFDHIRLLGKTHSPPTTKNRLKPYPLNWATE